jgi:hypothetical protein
MTEFPKLFTASDQYENISTTYLCQLAVSHYMREVFYSTMEHAVRTDSLSLGLVA